MDFNSIEKVLSSLEMLKSNESTCYIENDAIYKIFNESVNINRRLNIIDIFIKNNIPGCPLIYDYIYDNEKVIGYVMKYYKNLIQLTGDIRFNYLKDKCLELIDIYLRLKNDYNICYSDFHSKNIFLNHNSILLLDVDSCIKKNDESSQVADRLLCDFILSIIYNISFFQYEVYYLAEERSKIRDTLYEFTTHDSKNLIQDLTNFVANTSKHEVKKKLKKL